MQFFQFLSTTYDSAVFKNPKFILRSHGSRGKKHEFLDDCLKVKISCHHRNCDDKVVRGKEPLLHVPNGQELQLQTKVPSIKLFKVDENYYQINDHHKLNIKFTNRTNEVFLF